MHNGKPLTIDHPPAIDRDGDAEPGVCVLGVRGGVGTSTIAHALGIPDQAHDVAGLAYGSAVVVVTSPAVADTERLLAVVDQCRVRGRGPIVVAVVDDGHGRWPAASRARLRMIRDSVEVVAVPWVARWRWRGTDDLATTAWRDAVARVAEATRIPTEGMSIGRQRRRRRKRRRRERR